MATIDQLLKAASTEQLKQMSDEQLLEYFKDAIMAEPPAIPRPLAIAHQEENEKDDCPIKGRKKKDKKDFNLTNETMEFDNL